MTPATDGDKFSRSRVQPVLCGHEDDTEWVACEARKDAEACLLFARAA
jgi:hypothetical protein